jgi:hypothetical protein
MEAISTSRRAGISRRLVVLAAIIAAFALGGTSGYAVKALSLPATPSVQPSAAAEVVDGPQSDLTRVLPGEGSGAADHDADGNGPQSDLTRVLPGEVPSPAGQDATGR